MPRRRPSFPFAIGEGAAARLVREFDWSSTPLGPPAQWPAELKTAVGFILESRFPAAIVWGPGLVTIYNEAFRPILGDKPEAMGRSFAEVWAEACNEIAPIAARAFAGEATYIENFPLEIDRSGRLEKAWFTFCYSPIRLADGTIAGMMDTVVETSQTVRARADLELLNHELGHRLNNTLAMVQAIAQQTLRDVTPREAVDAFRARLTALSLAHQVLLQQNWTATSLGEVAQGTLAPLDGLKQIALDGPEVLIGSRTAMTLSLILHELATNAAKYGALSVPDGRVALWWTTDGEMLQLRWKEASGPEVREPSRKGFGSRLTDMGLASGGVVRRRYPSSGFEVELDAPLAELSR